MTMSMSITRPFLSSRFLYLRLSLNMKGGIVSRKNAFSTMRLNPCSKRFLGPVLQLLNSRQVETVTTPIKCSTTKNPLRKKPPVRVVEKSSPGVRTVVALSSADEYNLENIGPEFLQRYSEYRLVELPDDIVEDALHFRTTVPDSTAPPAEAFIFREGSVVLWNVPENEQQAMLNLVNTWATNLFDKDLVNEEKETLDYTLDSLSNTRLYKGSIILNPESSLLEQYAFSNALSLSVKLAMWEMSLQEYIDSITPFARNMKNRKTIGLTEDDVLQKTGQLFALRHDINLRSDLLDTPDFYWDREKLESLFHQTCSTLNIQKRVKVMNEKLNHCCELMGLLNEHLKDKHHTRLEWMIIILIMVEVCFEFIHYYDRYYSSHEGPADTDKECDNQLKSE